MDFDLGDFDNIADQDLLDIYRSILDGAQTPAESLGFDDAALNSIERIAVGFYRAQHLGRAALIYGFLLRMSPKRASAWRGLGACAKTMKDYEAAGTILRHAAMCAPGDIITQVFLGECLCLLGETEEGIDILQKAVSHGAKTLTEAPYITRARAIVNANGGIPARVRLRQSGQRLTANIAAYAEKMGVEAPLVYDDTRDIEWEDIKKNPQLMQGIDKLKKALDEGTLSLAEIGGFTDHELDGAYACACNYTHMGQVAQALQIVGYLIMLDPHKARYYQLVGIGLQRVNEYQQANEYYELAMIFDKTDPMTAIYHGECKIMSGAVDEGVQWIKKGLDLASNDAAKHQKLIGRANALVQQFDQ